MPLSYSQPMGVTLTPPPYALYRLIRRDPTISLVRTLIKAAVVTAPWSVKSDDDAHEEWVKLVQDEMNIHRDSLIERAVLSGIDFGWQAWELIWDTGDGRTARLARAKDLLQDITRLKTDDHGKLIAIVQGGMFGPEVALPIEEHLHIAWRVEGTNWYGEPLLINAREIFQEWKDVQAAALRYDLKIAGSQLIIHYPANEPTTIDKDGVERSTYEVAREIGERLQAGGVAVIQSSVIREEVAGLQEQSPEWGIDVLDTKGVQPEYGVRLSYIDRLKVRAMGFPERAILEAETSGSRADSMTAAGFAIRNLELIHKVACRELNRQLVNRLLGLNFGPGARGRVRLAPGPLLETHRAELVKLATEVVRLRPDAVDIDTLLDQIDIPKSEEIVESVPAT